MTKNIGRVGLRSELFQEWKHSELGRDRELTAPPTVAPGTAEITAPPRLPLAPLRSLPPRRLPPAPLLYTLRWNLQRNMNQPGGVFGLGAEKIMYNLFG